MGMHSWELVGGDPALDLLNTIHDYTEEPRRDSLGSFEEALRWGVASGHVLLDRECSPPPSRVAPPRSTMVTSYRGSWNCAGYCSVCRAR